MNTFWILAHMVAFALGVATYSIARRGWKKAREFSKGPIPAPRPEAHGCYEEPNQYGKDLAYRREKEAKRIQTSVREFETNLARASKSRWN